MILSNSGIEAGKKVRADAGFIKLNRQLSPDVTTEVESEPQDLNENLNQHKMINYPNPFNSSTTIEFTFPANQKFELSLYNVLGQKINSLEGISNSSGINQIKIDSTNLAGGIYFCSVKGEKINLTTKLIILK